MSDNKQLKQFDKSAFTFVNSDRVLTDVKLDTKPVGYLRDAWNRFKKNKASVAATVIIVIIALFAIIAPWCTPYKINQSDGYYKQVRPKVSSKASGFWDGAYTDDINESGYIAMQAIALGALDQDGEGNMTWDEATDYALNPIRKVNKTFERTVKVNGNEVTTNFYNARIDSYYKVGFVKVEGLSLEQYHALLEWQEQTGKQIIYPMVDTSDPETFPESNKGDANEGNYWYAMTKNLTPLYPNDPDDLSKGYHEMTLDEVKEKGLWSLYASDYPRNEDGDVIWRTATGAEVAVSVSGNNRKILDADDNLLYTLNTLTKVYTDKDGKIVNQASKGSAFFYNPETFELTGAITVVDVYCSADGSNLLTSVDLDGNQVYADEDGNVFIKYNPETGAYSDGADNPLSPISYGTSVLFSDANGALLGAITTTKIARDASGNELTVVSENGITYYYNADGSVLYKEDSNKKYEEKDAAGKVVRSTRFYDADDNPIFVVSNVDPIFLRDASYNLVAGFTVFKGLYKLLDGTQLTTSKTGNKTSVSNNGQVLFVYNGETKSYEDAEGNPLNQATGSSTVFAGNNGSVLGGIFVDNFVRDEAGHDLVVTTQGGTTYYRLADNTLVYRYVDNGANGKFYFDAAGNKLSLIAGRKNLVLLDANYVVSEVAYPISEAFYDKDGNQLTVVPSYFDVNGEPLTQEQVDALPASARYYTDLTYYNAGQLIYSYNDRTKVYSDAEGNALTLSSADSVFFVNGQHEVIDGLQPPPKSELMMVKVTTSGEGGIYKNFAVRVLYYNYYQYLNGHEPVFVLGADSQGYDILVRLAHGCRLSLLLAVAVSLINLIIGAIYGAIEGYYGGAVDMVMERITDILSGIPFIILVTLFKMHLVDQGKVSVVGGLLFAFMVTGWIGTAYATRMQFYRFKGQEYILAARTLGANDARLMFKHIFPNALGTLITSSVLVIPGVIFSETSLAYLGIVNFNGANTTSLGTMLSNGQSAGIDKFPHIILFPALILSLLMISFNLFGNGLRDAFNPSLRGTED